MLHYQEFKDIFRYMVIEQLQAFQKVQIKDVSNQSIEMSYEQLFDIKTKQNFFFVQQRTKIIKQFVKQNNKIKIIFPNCCLFKSQKEFRSIQQQQRFKLKLSYQLRQAQIDQKIIKKLLQKYFHYNSYNKQEFYELYERQIIRKFVDNDNIKMQRALNGLYQQMIYESTSNNSLNIADPIILCSSEHLSQILTINERGNILLITKNLIAQKLNLQKSKISFILFWSIVIFLSQNNHYDEISQTSIQENLISICQNRFRMLKQQSNKLITLMLTLDQIDNLKLNFQNLYAFSRIFETRYELMNKNFQYITQNFVYNVYDQQLQLKKFYKTKINQQDLNQNYFSKKGLQYIQNLLIPKQYCYLLGQKSKKIIFNDRYFVNQSRELFYCQKKSQKKQKMILNNIKNNLFIKIPITIVLKQYYNDQIFQNLNKIQKPQQKFIYFNDSNTNLFQSVLEQVIYKKYKLNSDQNPSVQQITQMSILNFYRKMNIIDMKKSIQNYKAKFLLHMSQENYLQEALLFLEFLSQGYLDRKVFLSTQDDFAFSNHKFFKNKKNIFTIENYYQYVSDLMNEDLLFLIQQKNLNQKNGNDLDLIWKTLVQNDLQSKTFFQQNHQQVLADVFLKQKDLLESSQSKVFWELLANEIFQNVDALYFINLMASFQEFDGHILFCEEVRTLRIFSYLEEIKNTSNSIIQSNLIKILQDYELDPLQFQSLLFKIQPYKKILLPKTISILNEFLILVLVYPLIINNMPEVQCNIKQKMNLLKKALTSQESFLLTRTLNFAKFAKEALSPQQLSNQSSLVDALQLLDKSIKLGDKILKLFSQRDSNQVLIQIMILKNKLLIQSF